MGYFYMEPLDSNDEFKLFCNFCHSQLCYNFEIISTDYKCKNGKALFVSLVYLLTTTTYPPSLFRRNIDFGQKHTTCLTSGTYDVLEMYCRGCNQELGWNYVSERLS